VNLDPHERMDRPLSNETLDLAGLARSRGELERFRKVPTELCVRLTANRGKIRKRPPSPLYIVVFEFVHTSLHNFIDALFSHLETSEHKTETRPSIFIKAKLQPGRSYLSREEGPDRSALMGLPAL